MQHEDSPREALCTIEEGGGEAVIKVKTWPCEECITLHQRGTVLSSDRVRAPGVPRLAIGGTPGVEVSPGSWTSGVFVVRDLLAFGTDESF